MSGLREMALKVEPLLHEDGEQLAVPVRQLWK